MFDIDLETLPDLGVVEPVPDVTAAPSGLAPASEVGFDQEFDAVLDGGCGSGLALGRLVEVNVHELRVRETRQLRLAAAWADLHDADPDQPYSPLVERASLLGGPGTPEVAEFCVAEFAALQGLSFSSGRALMADALDVRHRLPQLWSRVLAGAVRAWKARKVADATRALSSDAAAAVDGAVCGLVECLPWPRFEPVLGAAILDADPELMRNREVKARTERRVWASDHEHGLKTLVARADAGDVTWFMAAVNRIAEILQIRGDTDLVGVRRAKAVGILAQPAIAVQMLADHATDTYVAPGGPLAGAEAAPPQDMDLVDTLLADADPVEPETPTPPHPIDQAPREEFPRERTIDDDLVSWEADRADEVTHISLDVRVPPWLSRVDPKALRPRIVLYFHLGEAAVASGEGLIRPQHGQPLTLVQLGEWLSRTGCPVQVRPVVVPAEVEPADGYEIPARVREAVRLREIAEVWPYGTSTASSLDLDHTTPYVPMSRGGPPSQTGPGRLGPLGRLVHRVATHGRWRRRQPAPGVYLWRSPSGWIFLVTNQGTLGLGNHDYAHAIWSAATPPEQDRDAA